MASYKEQRASERFPVNTSSECVFMSPVLEDCGPVKLINISTDGVGLVAGLPLHPGLLLAIKIVNPAKKFDRTMLVRVVHATAQAGGTYLVGGTFETPLTYEELCILVM